MQVKNFVLLMTILALLLVPGISQAQEVIGTSKQRVDFYLIVDPMSYALETWDETNPPDTVKLAAYQVASGYLMGIPFHYEANRNRVTITEQVDEVAKDLQFVGTSSIEDCTRFDFAIFVPSQTVDTAQMGAGLQVHGESDEDNLAVARETARKQAMDEAVRTAISQAYLRQNKPLPGSLDGRISWYEISNEGRDPDSGTYTVDMTVWVTLPQQPSPAAQSGGQSDGQSSGESNGQS